MMAIDGVSLKFYTPTTKTLTLLLKLNQIVLVQSGLIVISYIVDPNNPINQVCLEIGLCDSLDSEGQCNNFIEPEKKTKI